MILNKIDTFFNINHHCGQEILRIQLKSAHRNTITLIYESMK